MLVKLKKEVDGIVNAMIPDIEKSLEAANAPQIVN
jgi:hypothetical protein